MSSLLAVDPGGHLGGEGFETDAELGFIHFQNLAGHFGGKVFGAVVGAENGTGDGGDGVVVAAVVGDESHGGLEFEIRIQHRREENEIDFPGVESDVLVGCVEAIEGVL